MSWMTNHINVTLCLDDVAHDTLVAMAEAANADKVSVAYTMFGVGFFRMLELSLDPNDEKVFKYLLEETKRGMGSSIHCPGCEYYNNDVKECD